MTFAIVFILLVSCAYDANAAEMARPAPRMNRRQPVAMAFSGNRLLIGNRRSGTLSRMDTDSFTLCQEKTIGKSLSDLAVLADGRILFTDEVAGEVVVARERGEDVDILQRISVAASPVSIVISPRQQLASVASLWARRITLLRTSPHVETWRTIDLPFAPRLQLLLPGGQQIVVADAFQGCLAVIDTEHGKLVTIRDLNAHNIRGLARSADGQRVLVAHQTLLSHVPTTENRISWGQVVSNLLRTIDVTDLLDGPVISAEQSPRPIGHWVLEPLGEHKHAAGDPGQVTVTADGRRIVCLSGVHEVAVGRDGGRGFTRLRVGVRPTNVVLDSGGSLAFVANTFDDSISVLDIQRADIVDTVSLGKMPELSLAAQGERLFYDARLSFDGWFSCHSCHTDGHTTGLLNDNFGDASQGTPKRILSLLGTNDSGPWGWDGGKLWLNDQIVASLDTTMRNPQPHFFDDARVAALTDYLRSLDSPPSLRVSRDESRDTPEIRRGREIFQRYECWKCHAPPTYTSERFVDVGLEDEVGQSQFNPPSLRGVSQQHAWFHDNRAARLRDVFEKHGHPSDSTWELTTAEIDDLVEFLNSL